MEKWEIRLPLTQKPLNRTPLKFAWVITSGTPTPMQNLIRYDYPSTPPLCSQSPNMRKCASSDPASFCSSYRLQPRPLHRFSRSISQMTWFRASMCLLEAPKTKLYMSTSISHKRQIFANFLGTFALTMRMLNCKLPLIVIVTQWKLYGE